MLVWPTIIVSLIPEFKELSPAFVRYTFFLSDDSMTVLLLRNSMTVTQLIVQSPVNNDNIELLFSKIHSFQNN